MPRDPHPPAPTPDAIKAALRRRSFLKASAAVALAPALAGPARAGASAAAGSRGPRTVARGKARNLIFMVSDGMSVGTLTLADLYCRLHRDRPSHWLSLLSKPGVRRGLYDTASADSMVTDSAAAGSTWGCGHRVNNSVLNITPDRVQRMPLLVQAAQSGKATGLVTTTRVTHATPASFIVNCPRRDWEGPIAAQMLERPLDLAMGGGARYFSAALRDPGKGTLVVRDAAALAASLDAQKPDRLLGLFADSHMPFVLDAPVTVPSLAAMTRAALGHLDGRRDGFVLQIEGGRVDHAAHSNDAAALISEQVAFDDALAEVLAFLDGGRRDDTLLVVTTDHGNANPGLTLYGREGREGLARLSRVTRSFEWIIDRIKAMEAGDRAARAHEVVEQATGIALDADERRILASGLAGGRTAPFRALGGFDSTLGGLLANHFGVGFVSGNHTADLVELAALGPGSEDIAPTGRNVDLHPVIVAALGLAPGEPLPDMREPAEFPAPPKPD